MIETIMFVALGFLLASLLALLLAPPLWRRAVRLTTRKLESTMPMSVADIQADKDQLRAEFAIKLRRLEIALEKAKDKAARHLVERNRSQAANAELKAEIKALKAVLVERSNAVTVLEQSVRRVPELEGQLGRAREIILSRDAEIQKLKRAYAAQADALTHSKQASQAGKAEIEQLRRALEGGRRAAPARSKRAALSRGSEAPVAEDQKLAAEVSRLREQNAALKQTAMRERELLRSEMRALAEQVMHGGAAAPKPSAPSTSAEKPSAAKAPPQVRPAVAARQPAETEGQPKTAPVRGKTPRKRAVRQRTATKPAAKTPDGKVRMSLTERLKSLAGSDSS